MNDRRIQDQNRHLSEKAYHLQPGYVYFSSQDSAIRTVVGSCVAVCLWDKKLKQGGMNHFLYPSTRNPNEATPKYGNVATIALIQLMEEAGSQHRNMVAQIVGGASPNKATSDIGMQNVTIADTILKKRGIKIISTDTGGNMGRKVIFDLQTGHLVVVKVHKLRATDWINPHD